MTTGIASLAPVIAVTWPPERLQPCGPFLIAQSTGGGSRVRAARLTEAAHDGSDVTTAQIAEADAAMAALDQPRLFMVLDGQTALDAQLAAMGYTVKDQTLALSIATAQIAAPPPPVTCFQTWPPLAIQQDIWAAGGIGPDRLAIMARAEGPKFTLFGRIKDKPAASAYVGLHGKMAMLHALEVLPEARRAGLAGYMMRAAALWAQDAGADTLSVLVTRENLPAQALYTSLGFEPVGHYHYRVRQA